MGKIPKSREEIDKVKIEVQNMRTYFKNMIHRLAEQEEPEVIDTSFTKNLEALEEIDSHLSENAWQVLDEGETLSTRINELKNDAISLICQLVFERIPISSRASIPKSNAKWKVIS